MKLSKLFLTTLLGAACAARAEDAFLKDCIDRLNEANAKVKTIVAEMAFETVAMGQKQVIAGSLRYLNADKEYASTEIRQAGTKVLGVQRGDSLYTRYGEAAWIATRVEPGSGGMNPITQLAALLSKEALSFLEEKNGMRTYAATISKGGIQIKTRLVLSTANQRLESIQTLDEAGSLATTTDYSYATIQGIDFPYKTVAWTTGDSPVSTSQEYRNVTLNASLPKTWFVPN